MYRNFYPPLEPDCFYHIFNRRIQGEDLFKEERNYSYFKILLAQHLLSCADILSYCLMKNHFHMHSSKKYYDISTQKIKFQKNFSNLFDAYTKPINKLYKRTGNIFETPFKRKKLTSDSYITLLIYYVHASSKT